MKKQFTLSPIFSDNMIFQADKPIRIFGQCKKGIDLSISFLDQELKIRTNTDSFLFELNPVSYRDKGFSFTLYTKKQEHTIYHCVIGDVFLIIGGKNVYMPLKDSYHKPDYHEANVRYLNLNKSLDEDNKFTDIAKWEISGIDDLDNFSALGYVFAKQLHTLAKVPIGVVTANNLETSIFSWMSSKEIHSHIEVAEYIKRIGTDVETRKMNPTLFFEEMVSKLIPISFKAIIFYQGENDHHNIKLYGISLTRIIQAYRIYFRDPEIPFIMVQLPGYAYKDSIDDNVSLIRQIQANIMSDEKKIFMVPAIDLGEEDNQYLKEKHKLVKRLVSLVLEKVYRVAKSTLSPMYYSHSVQDDSLVIFTKNNYLNLVSHSRKNLGFSSSVDGITFTPIENVRLQNNQIVIKGIEGIKEIKYAYDDYPVCDIYTTNELPLLPFKITI